MDEVTILNIKLKNISRDDLLANLHEGILMPINVDLLVKLQKDKLFFDVYKIANWRICDSKIVALGLKILGTPVKEVIQGSSFFPTYCSYHKDNPNIRIFLLGAGPGVADKAMNNINGDLDCNIIVGAHSPSYGFENKAAECDEIIRIIKESGATVLAIGVGAPKQEKWIYRYKDKLPNIRLFMAIGATIDFEAGNIKRAPVIFQKLALEWLYRMIKDPKRLIKRYLIDDLPFFYYVLKQKLGFYKDPFKN